MFRYSKDTTGLSSILSSLNNQREENEIGRLAVDVTGDYMDEDALLWQVLSHAHCKIHEVQINEKAKDALVKSRMMKHVRRWCETVPSKSPRSICMCLQRGNKITHRDVLNDLRAALLHPNSNVQQLAIEGDSSAWSACEGLLRPILEAPENRLISLSLQMGSFSMCESEARAFSMGLSSPHCKLQMFTMDSTNLTFPAARSILVGSITLDNLKQLKLLNDMPILTNTEKVTILTQLSELLARPGNVLRTCFLKAATWGWEHFSVLAKALGSEHYKVDELKIVFNVSRKDHFDDLRWAAAGLFDVVGTLAYRLQSMSMISDIGDGFIGYRDSMAITFRAVAAQSNGGLEFLVMPQCRSALPIVEALKKGQLPHLAVLDVGEQRPFVFRALTASLPLAHCNVRRLILDENGQVDHATRSKFHSALRTSRVLFLGNRISNRFRRAFNGDFLQVLHTLSSINYVPRLTRYIWLRTVPFRDFILKIAETLAWPLDDLRITAEVDDFGNVANEE